MKATVMALQYKMNDVLKALARNEKVTVFHRGKLKEGHHSRGGKEAAEGDGPSVLRDVGTGFGKIGCGSGE